MVWAEPQDTWSMWTPSGIGMSWRETEIKINPPLLNFRSLPTLSLSLKTLIAQYNKQYKRLETLYDYTIHTPRLTRQCSLKQCSLCMLCSQTSLYSLYKALSLLLSNLRSLDRGYAVVPDLSLVVVSPGEDLSVAGTADTVERATRHIHHRLAGQRTHDSLGKTLVGVVCMTQTVIITLAPAMKMVKNVLTTTGLHTEGFTGIPSELVKPRAITFPPAHYYIVPPPPPPPETIPVYNTVLLWLPGVNMAVLCKSDRELRPTHQFDHTLPTECLHLLRDL